jgi:hypothetical protein
MAITGRIWRQLGGKEEAKRVIPSHNGPINIQVKVELTREETIKN